MSRREHATETRTIICLHSALAGRMRMSEVFSNRFACEVVSNRRPYGRVPEWCGGIGLLPSTGER